MVEQSVEESANNKSKCQKKKKCSFNAEALFCPRNHIREEAVSWRETRHRRKNNLRQLPVSKTSSQCKGVTPLGGKIVHQREHMNMSPR